MGLRDVQSSPKSRYTPSGKKILALVPNGLWSRSGRVSKRLRYRFGILLLEVSPETLGRRGPAVEGWRGFPDPSEPFQCARGTRT